MNEIVTVAVSLCIVFPLREGRISSLPTRPSRSVKSGVPLFKLGRPHIDKSGVPMLQSDSSYELNRPRPYHDISLFDHRGYRGTLTRRDAIGLDSQ